LDNIRPTACCGDQYYYLVVMTEESEISFYSYERNEYCNDARYILVVEQFNWTFQTEFGL
jgi:hypothetical protein